MGAQHLRAGTGDQPVEQRTVHCAAGKQFLVLRVPGGCEHVAIMPPERPQLALCAQVPDLWDHGPRSNPSPRTPP